MVGRWLEGGWKVVESGWKWLEGGWKVVEGGPIGLVGVLLLLLCCSAEHCFELHCFDLLCYTMFGI